MNSMHCWYYACVHSHDGLNPNCLQTTSASLRSQTLSHTVPHSPLTHTSTLPSSDVDPFISRTAPLVHDDNTIQDQALAKSTHIKQVTFHQTMYSYITRMRVVVII